MADMPKLTPAQRAALKAVHVRTLHRVRAGYEDGAAARSRVVPPATADALVRMGLAEKYNFGTALRITRRGKEVAREIALPARQRP